ncbi:MAG TPA: HD domain-containing protein [Solirubrobacteraceae bacterium]|jgi:(p)ppGpp synthase/HD superfamily hydrolase|nr:HD domain-containing protein [Solirubrobacteraceae bacterium]
MTSAAMHAQASDRSDAPQSLGERFADALGYAVSVHRGQTRRGRPYVAHLLRVTGMVLEDGGSEDEAIAALLHDAAEDQGGRRRLQDIRGRYGDAVAAIVDSCTDSYEQPPPPWRTRKERYLEHLPSASAGALLVSLADKVDNVRGILREVVPAVGEGERAAAEHEDACWYYVSLARLFVQLRPGARADELAGMAGELERLTRAT